jgi:ethanolamine utilization protein EutA
MKQILTSVGIDIGTTTTQLVFCQLQIENMAAAWTVPTVRIVDKRIIYTSQIHFTPMVDDQTLNSEAIKAIITKEYETAGIRPHEVDTGAVIITGEAARKENAENIITMLSELAGNFVVTTAGPDLEGILAGKGSGAAHYSRQHACTVMNFDIGGGTTNVSVFKNGETVDSACFDIGGRLVQFGPDGQVTYLSKKVQLLLRHLGIKLTRGEKPTLTALRTLSEAMAHTIVNIARHNMTEPVLQLLITDHGLTKEWDVDYISLSGGVADCLSSQSTDYFVYGDLGVLLGEVIERTLEGAKINRIIAKETIRATVIGAGIHTTNISGSTIHYTVKALPLRDIPVIKLSAEEEEAVGQKRVEAIHKRLKWATHGTEQTMVALGLKGSRQLGFDALRLLAKDVAQGLSAIDQSEHPLIIVIEQDMAMALGLCIRENLSRDKPVICIDSIHVDNGDYIDIGIPVADGQVLPVIIKTLLFGY